MMAALTEQDIRQLERINCFFYVKHGRKAASLSTMDVCYTNRNRENKESMKGIAALRDKR